MSDNLTYQRLQNSIKGNNKIFYDTFIQNGYSPVQAVGMIGNLMYESGGYEDINPSAGEKGGSGFGAAQWTDKTRKLNLQKFANGMNMSIHDPKAQAQFIVHELNNGYAKTGMRLKNTNDIKSAMDIFLREYENPKYEHQQEGSNSYNKRLGFANSIYNEGVNKTETWNGSTSQPKPKFWFDDVQVGNNNSGLKDNAFAVMSILKQKFPELRVTSGLRKASDGVGKNSKNSRHNIGEAFDIAGNHKDVFDYLNTQEGLSLLDRYGLGVLDETDPEIMKKTGATGAHFHIGADTKLVSQTKSKLLSFGNNFNNSSDEEQDSEKERFRQSGNGDNSLVMEALSLLKQQLNDKQEASIAELRAEELRNQLKQKQQERDYLKSQILSTNLPFIERGY